MGEPAVLRGKRSVRFHGGRLRRLATAACAGSVRPFDFGLNVSNRFLSSPRNQTPATFQGTIQSQNRDFKQGRVQQFNLNIEHQLPGNVVLTLGYAGSRSHHILVDGMNLNVAVAFRMRQLVPGYTLGCGIPTAPVRTVYHDRMPTPTSDQLVTIRFRSRPKPRARGTDFTPCSATPTPATSTPDSRTAWVPARARPTGPCREPKADWGLSQIQLNHNFTASVIYDLPFGKGKQFGSSWSGVTNAVLGDWQVNVIEKITSGFPFSSLTATNDSGVNHVKQRKQLQSSQPGL